MAVALAACSSSSARATSRAAVTVCSSASIEVRSAVACVQAGLVGLAPLHHIENDLLQVTLPTLQRLDLGLQVLKFLGRGDHAAIEPLPVTIDAGAYLLHVRFGFGLLAAEVTALRGQGGDRVTQHKIAIG